MSHVVNLNRARKDRGRAAAKRVADENAVTFGRSKAERDRLKAEVEKLAVALDRLKMDR